jgi:hypothetical protein
MGVAHETGWQGYAPEGVRTVQPQKTPQGAELPRAQQERTRLSARIRMVMEPIMAGRNRCRLVKAMFRHTTAQYDDLVMESACGWHTLRVHCRESSKLICDNV